MPTLIQIIEQARQAQQVHIQTHDVQLEIPTMNDIRTEILDRVLDPESPYYTLTEFQPNNSAFFNAPIATKLAPELRAMGYECDAQSDYNLEWED